MTTSSLLLALVVVSQAPPIRFSEVARASGIDLVTICGEPDKPRFADGQGAGICWFDYDGDGWLDLFVPNGSTLAALRGEARNRHSDRLYRNRGDGTFEDVTRKAGLVDDRWGMGVAAGDYDNDGDEDLYVCNLGLNFLYRNNGDGTFTDVAAAAGVTFDGCTPGAAWSDYDGDGDLDLYVTAYAELDPRHPGPAFSKTLRGMRVSLGPLGLRGLADKLFRNEGDGRFTDVSKEAGLRTTETFYGLTVQMVDLDRDDRIDIFVANDMTPNHYYAQLAPGRFSQCGMESGLLLDENGLTQACMGIATADLNDDLIPDFYVTNFSGQTNALYVSQGDGTWDDRCELTERARTAIPYVGWGDGFFDFDCDGDEDLAVFNGHVYPQLEEEQPRLQRYFQPPLLYRCDGPLVFSDATKSAGSDFDVERCIRGAAFADYDEDGDVDIALHDLDRPVLLLRNDTGRQGHFLRVQLLGTTINRDAYGSRVIVESGGRRQTRFILGQGSYVSQNDPRAHFGLGIEPTVDRITVRWTGGKEEVIEPPLAVDDTIVIKEGMGRVAELPAGQVWTRAMTAALTK